MDFAIQADLGWEGVEIWEEKYFWWVTDNYSQMEDFLKSDRCIFVFKEFSWENNYWLPKIYSLVTIMSSDHLE